MATPGGAKLRALREMAGRAQLWVEAEASLGTGYLQRLESGRVAQPERPTLERILTALDARYSERREVFALFGYTVVTPAPSEADRAWARAVSRRELHAVPFPAYVLDCTHHLIAWNGYLPRLLGVAPDAPLPGRLAERSFLAAWFDPDAPLAPLVAEPERFLPALIRAMRYEMQAFGGEPWYATVLAELQALPRFRQHWAAVEREPPPVSAARALTPVRLLVPSAGLLQFQLSSETFIRDARFRAIYLFPADPETMRQCAAWAYGSQREVSSFGAC
jgi:transcriptional regulator with XRE-family HTH domain